MSATLPILQAFEARLKAQLPQWDIQLMPNDPSEYFLAHPNGAVLISYAGSQFDKPRPTNHIVQSRTLKVLLTVMSRDLHNDHGALALLDELRLSLTGFCPPNCGQCWLLEEQFDEYETGIWLYQLVIATDTVQVEQVQAASDQTRLVGLVARQQGQPLDGRLSPKEQQ